MIYIHEQGTQTYTVEVISVVISGPKNGDTVPYQAIFPYIGLIHGRYL